MFNFPRVNGEYNFTGYNAFYFLPKSAITTIGDVNAGIVNVITYSGSADWYVGYSIQDKLTFNDEPAREGPGVYFPVSLKGIAPVDKPEYLSLFEEMVHEEFIVIIKDNNGRLKLLGTLQKGLRFIYKTEGVGYTFEFVGDYDTPPPFYVGSMSLSSGSTVNYRLPIKYHYYIPSGYLTQVNTYDYAWQEANVFAAARASQPTLATLPILVDFYTLHTSTPNIFGNTSRFTDVNGNPLPTFNPNGTYVVDHYTGLGWVALNQQATLNFPSYQAIVGASNSNGFTDWMIPSRPAAETIINYSDGTINHLGYSYINFLWSSYFPFHGWYFIASSTFVTSFESANLGYIVMFRKHF